MRRTLWRGDELLGHLMMRDDSFTSAYLVPAPGAVLHGVQQTRIPVLGEMRVFQDALEPAISGSEKVPDAASETKPLAELVEVSGAEAIGVPASDQLRVGDDEGAEIRIQSLWLHERRYDLDTLARVRTGFPGVPAERIPDEACVGGSVWDVVFTLDES
jgi:hypothetical protein